MKSNQLRINSLIHQEGSDCITPKSASIVWGAKMIGKTIWTRNAVKGISVRGERRRREEKIEWRNWDPNRSKIAATILKTKNKADIFLPRPGSTCLYLGSSIGGTVSHIHDIVCGNNNHHNGQIVAVDISPRMIRDMSALSEIRDGILPVLADARIVGQISPFLRKNADWIHQDLSIADQALTFVKIISHFLSTDGIGILSLKAASERSSEGNDNSRFKKAQKIIQDSGIRILERVDISSFEDQHQVFICTKN